MALKGQEENVFAWELRVGKCILMKKNNLDGNLNLDGKPVQILAEFLITPLTVEVGAIEHSWWQP